MPTPNLSDNELDALFRRTTAAYPTVDATEGWHRMEPQLNSLARYQLAMRRVVRWFVAELGLVLLMLLGWFTYAPQLQEKVPQDTASAPSSLQQPTAPTMGSSTRKASPNSSLALDKEQALLANNATPQASFEARETAPKYLAAARSALAARRKNPAPTNRYLPLISTPKNKEIRTTAKEAVAQPDSSSSFGAGSTIHSAATPSTATTTIAKDTSESAASRVVTIMPPATVEERTAVNNQPPTDASLRQSTTDSATTSAPPAVVTAKPSDTTSSGRKPRLKPTYRVGVALQYAPEVSAVRMSEIDKTGRDVGVQLEYFFTPRLSLNTGILHAVKRYETRGADYHVQYGNVPLDRVYAVCGMLDVPLNLRYALLYRPNHQVFASAGLSSLFMRDEQYDLWYTYSNQPVRRTKQVVNGSNHLLSVLNISAGYERQVQTRWGVRAEPFVKIPLGGVGYGKVKLSSAGVFFSVQYRLLQPVLAQQ